MWSDNNSIIVLVVVTRAMFLSLSETIVVCLHGSCSNCQGSGGHSVSRLFLQSQSRPQQEADENALLKSIRGCQVLSVHLLTTRWVKRLGNTCMIEDINGGFQHFQIGLAPAEENYLLGYFRSFQENTTNETQVYFILVIGDHV